MPSFTLGLIFTVDDESESTDFEIAIQELIDNAPEGTVIDAATITTPDGTVIDMLQETDVETREHRTSAYSEDASSAETQEGASKPQEETAEDAIPTDKEF